MRKSLAIILAAVMMLSLAIVGVSAADPEVITTAEQFAAIKVDGNYKLGADIAVASTLVFKDAEDKEVPFTGTLDGAGYTITVSAPVFNSFGGTAKNIVFEGEIAVAGTDAYAASLANYGKGTVTITNVSNKANITTGFRGAGIIAQINNGATAVITSCDNYGTIHGTGEKSGMIGGIVGYQQGNTLVLEKCVNYGAVSDDTGLAGGIIGRFGGDYSNADVYTCDITNCVNKGSVTGSTQIGGIAGYARSVTITFLHCTNEGAVSSTGNDAAGILACSNVAKGTTKDGTKDVSNCGNSFIIIDSCVNKGSVEAAANRGAGICGYVWAGGGADSIKNHVEIINNVNYGEIKGTSHVSQIMAYTNSADNIVKNNVGLGKIAAAGSASPKKSFYSFSSAAIPAELKDNIIVDDGTEYATYTATDGKGDNIIEIKAEAAAAMVAVKTEADAKAAADALKAGLVSGTVIGYVAPADPSQGGSSVVTGDTALIVMIVCAVSLLGMGIALKARKA